MVYGARATPEKVRTTPGFLERDIARAIGEKPGEVGFSGVFSLVLSLDEQRKNKEDRMLRMAGEQTGFMKVT